MFWADCFRACGLASWVGSYRGCGSAFCCYIWSSHCLFVYSNIHLYIQVLIPPLAREKLNSSGKAKFLDLYGLGGGPYFSLVNCI